MTSCLVYIGDEILHNYVGMIISHEIRIPTNQRGFLWTKEDSYEPKRIQWKVRPVSFRASFAVTPPIKTKTTLPETNSFHLKKHLGNPIPFVLWIMKSPFVWITVAVTCQHIKWFELGQLGPHMFDVELLVANLLLLIRQWKIDIISQESTGNPPMPPPTQEIRP